MERPEEKQVETPNEHTSLIKNRILNILLVVIKWKVQQAGTIIGDLTSPVTDIADQSATGSNYIKTSAQANSL